ncbi:hypothetical protein V3C99_001649 [Haemonchus contortus]|uniref:Reverse transcriptase n=1 Tax=Haemonchus contortus TaxID=6289 RepID=A0A7I4YBX9_HAECO|nr:unnamed protein product [Haemonchus contortus]
MPRLLAANPREEDGEQCSCDGSDDLQRAFSELSSYYSGLTSATDMSSSEVTTSSRETSRSDGDEDEEDSSEYDSEESTGSSVSSSYSTHPSDTSYDLSTLIEETDREKLANFVRLRPFDRKWVSAAWKYTESEPTFRRKSKMTKVVRKIRTDIKLGFHWTELHREYHLRHPLDADGKTIQELRRLSLDACFRPLPDLYV